jgi:alkylation response protein AidB-like acyl-CoA dehydrogenase
MDFRLGEKGEQLRTETAAFLDEVLTGEMLEECHQTGVNHDPSFAKALAERGWLTLGWAVEDGGQGRDPLEVLAHSEEMQRRNAPTYAIGTTMMVAQVVQMLGTSEQKQEIIPKALSADIVIALGFTEPENGSDAAAAATKAVRAGDGWIINGSKMFTTNAQIADYVFMLARTNTEAKKHHGLTTFLVPMNQPGVEIQKVDTLSGERTNITYYNDVHVSDQWRIGEVDGGWRVMGAALAREHAASFAGEQYRLLRALIAWAGETTDANGISHRDSAAVREQIGRSRAELEVSTLLQRRAAWLLADGQPVQGKGSMSKLFSTERLEKQAANTLEIVGPDAIRSYDDPTTVQGGCIEHMVRHAKGTTIYAGTSEIQRNIIAQHVLGLPRPF